MSNIFEEIGFSLFLKRDAVLNKNNVPFDIKLRVDTLRIIPGFPGFWAVWQSWLQVLHR